MVSEARNELHEHCRAAMGDDLGDLYFHLWQEFSWLNFSYAEFHALFGTDNDHIVLMNRYGRDFFRLVERLLWYELFLGLCRITDKPRSAGKQNLTIQAIPGHIQSDSLREQVKRLVDTAVSRTAFARDWRNRQIAHRDLLKTLDPQLHALTPATRGDLEVAFAALQEVFNKIELSFLNSTTAFAVGQYQQGSAVLMHHLKTLAHRERPDA